MLNASGPERESGAAVAEARRLCEQGQRLAQSGEPATAAERYRRALEIDPGSAEAHHNLAQALYRLGEVESALEHLQRAAAADDALSTWLALATIAPCCPSLGHADVLRIRQTFARRMSEAVPQHNARPAARPVAGRQLRVGYVSAFVDCANYMKPVWSLWKNHDRDRLRLHVFTDSALPPDSEEFLSPQDRVHFTSGLGNRGLIDLIREQRLDLLIDLNGYSAPQRLPVWLVPHAPVTACWFNNYATSGLPGIDTTIADSSVIRPWEHVHYSERVVCLKRSYLSFDVPHPTPPVSGPPCAEVGCFTFGSLLSQYKLTGVVLDAWAEVLRRTAGTRLLLANSALGDAGSREHLMRRLVQRGVDPARVVLCGPAPHLEFLRYYDHIDLALDGFPYSGGTTTMEALWQGVPVLSLEGDRWAARTTASLLRAAGLEDYLATSVAELVERAVVLSRPEARAGLSRSRSSMRERLRQSGVCDARSLAREMEALFFALTSRMTRPATPAVNLTSYGKLAHATFPQALQDPSGFPLTHGLDDEINPLTAHRGTSWGQGEPQSLDSRLQMGDRCDSLVMRESPADKPLDG